MKPQKNLQALPQISNKSNTQVSCSVPNYRKAEKKYPPTRGFQGTQDLSTGLPEESLKNIIDTGTVKSIHESNLPS